MSNYEKTSSNFLRIGCEEHFTGVNECTIDLVTVCQVPQSQCHSVTGVTGVTVLQFHSVIGVTSVTGVTVSQCARSNNQMYYFYNATKLKALHYMSPTALYAEAFRVLRPGGLLAIAGYHFSRSSYLPDFA